MEIIKIKENIVNIYLMLGGAIGGYIGQWVLVMCYFNQKIPDFINQEKVK